ncbi:RNA polymerase sigma factor [Rhodococcus sp. NPDC057297]|uniref:RNA polymerase sigma factor n=1 Tax=Rhodococcus sp. NPDC057297 TaxID=3346090 RepID=UPI00362ED75F
MPGVSEDSPDARIVAALVAGELPGLGDAYDRHSGHLFSYAKAMLADEDAAADVVHDAMLIAARRISVLRDPERFRSWLYAIARGECLPRRRRDRCDFRSTIASDATDEERSVQEVVATAAATSSPEHREVLDLSIRHGLADAEVAAVLGIGTHRASTLISRAREELERSTGTGRIRVAGAAAILRLFPLATAPFGLREKILTDSEMGVVVNTTTLDRTDRHGFPTHGPASGKVVWAAAAGSALLIAAGIGFLVAEPASRPTAPAQVDVAPGPVPRTIPATTSESPSPSPAPPTTTPAQVNTVVPEAPAPVVVPPAPAPVTTTAVVPTTTAPPVTTTEPPVTTTEPTSTTSNAPVTTTTQPQPENG